MSWNEPVTPPVLGLYRDDPRNVSLDGNGNLAIRATKEGDTYFTGRVESKIKIGINRTWEARIQLPMAPGLWPAYWLVNIENTPDGRGPLPDGEVDIVEWYGNGEWAPGTSVHARSDGKTWNSHRWPVDGAWHTYRCQWDEKGFKFWMDDFAGPPYFSRSCGTHRRRVAVQRPWLSAVHHAQPGGRRSRRRRSELRRPCRRRCSIDYIRVW